MNIENEVDVVKAPWQNSPYYEDAEKWTHLFWGENTRFRKCFDRLDLTSVIELACGFGRHSERVAPKAGKLILIDVFEENLDKCRDRLKLFNNVNYCLGNGYDLSLIQSNSSTAIFCYDAMVHFSMDIMLSYLNETSRVLKTGGMALYHHSNYQGPALAHYGQHPHARNVMNFDEFSDHARKSGLAIVESIPMDWGGVASLDRLSLVVKSA
jgi:ubiquinone/menaquinone biosynthesis C-methylase UbiE